jgi:hypothetical protein
MTEGKTPLSATCETTAMPTRRPTRSTAKIVSAREAPSRPLRIDNSENCAAETV